MEKFFFSISILSLQQQNATGNPVLLIIFQFSKLNNFCCSDFEREFKEIRESLDFGQIPVRVNGAATFTIFAAITLIAGIICFAVGVVSSRQNLINISAHFLSWAGIDCVF